LKRLLGYSSISNAGYLLLGVAALNGEGRVAVLYYLTGYLFTVVAAFFVICLVSRGNDSEDISILAGLNQRSPLLAATLTLAMVSLAGIPPLAGFFGKFLLLKSVIEQGAANHSYYVLVAVAMAGVIISLYYYFGVIRAIYWAANPADLSPIPISWPAKLSLWLCIAAMLYLGVLPGRLVLRTTEAARVLNSEPGVGVAQASPPAR
jgi:NADH-quinone oxidoreductase subunit N